MKKKDAPEKKSYNWIAWIAKETKSKEYFLSQNLMKSAIEDSNKNESSFRPKTARFEQYKTLLNFKLENGH